VKELRNVNSELRVWIYFGNDLLIAISDAMLLFGVDIFIVEN